MLKAFQLSHFYLFFCIILLLTACSGSDSGGLPSENIIEQQTANNNSSLVVEGNIINGSVKNAEVNFYLVEQGQLSTTSLATVYSDNAGEFSAQLELPENSQLILIKAVGQENRETEMLCEVPLCGSTEILSGIDKNNDGLIGFGENLYLSEEFELSTVVSIPDNNDTLRTSITPLTHIAVTQAQKENLTRENIEAHMARLASLMNLPSTLTQLNAIDSKRLVELFASEYTTNESDEIIYSVYSATFAAYANQNKLTIEAAIKDISDKLYADPSTTTFNRDMVLIILQNALEVASLYAGQNENLQGLISKVQLLLVSYYCDEYSLGEDDCEIVDPSIPEVPDEDELQVVKDFVADLREWTRDVTLQAGPAIENFTNRISMVEGIWEDDLQLLASSLNDLLPGIAQLVSPYYCGNSDECPFIDYVDYNHRRLSWRGLEYNLYTDSRLLTIDGELDGRVEVAMELQLPNQYSWDVSHSIAVTAGRLSHADVDLVLTEGSEVVAGFGDDLYFYRLMNQISNPYLSPNPSAMRFNANFLLQSEYERAIQSTIDFEADEIYLPVNLSGNWLVTEDRAHSGNASLRSKRITHRQSSQATARFNTKGGNLEFYSAIESESNYDYLRVYLDGQRVMSFSGYQPEFRRQVIYIPPGEHSVTWEYRKDGSVNRYADAAWIDRITFPAFANSDLPTEFKTRTILNGTAELSATKLDKPWVWATKGFLPSNINIDVTLSSDFDSIYEDGNVENAQDLISLRLSANVANAADFVPPQEIDENTLSIIGEYTVNNSVFTLNLPNQRFEVEQTGTYSYYYREYRENNTEPVQSSYYYLNGVSELYIAAGQLISNSAIGWPIVVPEEGLYISTLLGSSPWVNYPDSRFDENGGNVFGYLVQGYEPTETEAQYLRLSAAVEIDAKLEGLTNTLLGTAFTRSSLNDGKLGFYIESEGRRFNFESDAWYTPVLYNQDSEFEARNPHLTISNQEGVELFVELNITLDGEDDEQDKETLTGQISYNGNVYATLERIKGLTIIRYTDGSGESLE